MTKVTSLRRTMKMKKFTVTVEEHVSQDFSIEAPSREEAEALAEKMYRDGKLVLEPGNLLDVSFTANVEDE